MADALLSKEHFYVNASYYNDTDAEREAVIHIQDNQDILNRSDDWLVHITRFSCDSMQSLPYIVKDNSATWVITAFNEENSPTRTYKFILDRNYFTPQALVEAMNVPGRTIRETVETETDATAEEVVEMFRWQIDPEGRFRLKVQPDTDFFGHNITYNGSPSMNKLLGFDKITSFTRFQPNAVNRFVNCVRYLEKIIPKVATAQNIFSGRFHTQVNRVLVDLLAGVELVDLDENAASPQTTLPNLHSAVERILTYTRCDTSIKGVQFKGLVPVRGLAAGQALLPRGMSPVWMEWYDVRFPHHEVDKGHRAGMFQLNWDTAYNFDTGYSYDGRVKFRDLTAAAVTDPYIDLPYPVYSPANNTWTNTRYAYPANSLPGYYVSGDVVNSAGQVAFHTRTNLRHFNLTAEAAFLRRVEVGDDMWIVKPQEGHHTDMASHGVTFQIESKTDVTNAEVDVKSADAVGNEVEAAGFPQEVVFTNRRVPFQSRSQTFEFISTVADPGFASNINPYTTTLARVQWNTNASVGDTLYWVVDGVLQPEAYPIVAVTAATTNGGYAFITYTYDFVASGQIPVPLALITHQGTSYGVFIHKVAGDKARWVTDAKNMVLSATTFTYEHKNPDGVRVAQAQEADHISYPATYWQTYNEDALGEQVESFVKQLRLQSIFNDQPHPTQVSANGFTREQVDDEFSMLPAKTRVIRPYSGLPFVDLGGEQLADAEMIAGDQNKVLRRYGQGTHPTAIIGRFPQPFWAILAHLGGASVVQFVSAAKHDRPNLLVSASSNGVGDLVIRGQMGGAYKPAAPIVLGIAESIEMEECYLFWAPEDIHGMGGAIDAGAAGLQSQEPTANEGIGAIAYGQTSHTFNLAQKEMSSSVLLNDVPHRLFGFDGDYIASTYSSHVDLMFPFRQLIITSDDLQQLPEKSQDASSRQPILSSYTLSTLGNTTVDKEGHPAGGTSHPFGTVYFSESGARRYHHLLKLPGALRSFRLAAALTYKDNSKEPVKVKLMPGGQFAAQILFTRKMEETQ